MASWGNYFLFWELSTVDYGVFPQAYDYILRYCFLEPFDNWGRRQKLYDIFSVYGSSNKELGVHKFHHHFMTK